MKTTTSTLKDNKRLLSAYIKDSNGQIMTWDNIASLLLTTETSSNGLVGIFAVPEPCLNTVVSAIKVSKLYGAIFQPDLRLMSDQIMLIESFNELVDRWLEKGLNNAPRLCKGVSYPSQLRSEPNKVISSDNIWMLDLFSRGVAYTQLMSDKSAYLVADTTIYEGLNQFTIEDFRRLTSNLPSLDAGPILLDRYLNLLKKPQYRFVQQNSVVRNRYIRAICQVLGLPKPIQAEDLMMTRSYSKCLSMLLNKRASKILFAQSENRNSYMVRDFSPFVFAEELTLRELASVDGYIGPIREELPISVKVRGWHKDVSTTPTPIVWYTRPNRMPELNFSDSKSRVTSILGDLQNEILLQFIAENLIRLGLIERMDYTVNDTTQIVDVLFDVMKRVEASL